MSPVSVGARALCKLVPRAVYVFRPPLRTLSGLLVQSGESVDFCGGLCAWCSCIDILCLPSFSGSPLLLVFSPPSLLLHSLSLAACTLIFPTRG
jgi:hypothetical protein